MITEEDTVRRAVLDIITGITGRDVTTLADPAALPLTEGGLGLTSANMIQLLLDLEDACDVDLGEAVAETAEMRTVGDVIAMVGRH